MPEHNDPIDELTRFGAGFGSATPGGDMPLSAAAVRRRGDQIRRRRTALVAGGAALAVAAVAVPVFAVIGNGDPRSDDQREFTDDTTPALAESDLLRDQDTEYFPNEKGAFVAYTTQEGDEQATVQQCQQDKLDSIGVTRSFSRFFAPAQGEPGSGNGLFETVMQFDDPATARAAYDTWAQWILSCQVSGADRTTVQPQARSVDVPGADAVIYDLSWHLEPEQDDPLGDSGFLSEMGVLLQDDRMAIVAVAVNQSDYNFLDEDGGTPVKRMLPTAAERLKPGTADQPDAPTTTEPATDSTDAPDEPGSTEPVIADDFPIFDGWPEDAGDGDGRVGPERTDEALGMEACGVTADEPPYTDRVTARYDNAEDYRSRTLTTYASADDAVAAVAAIRQVFTDCPEGEVRSDGMTPNWAVTDTQLGGESFAILGWDTLDGQRTLYGDTALVVRLGSSVLVVRHGGHSGAPSGGDDQDAIDRIVQESAPVVSAMCAFTAAGC